MVSPAGPRGSPKRSPLHERSQSQNNASPTSSVRRVEGPEASAAGPFPTHPAHVLAPSQEDSYSGASTKQHPAVSDSSQKTDSPAKGDAPLPKIPPKDGRRALRRRKSRSPLRRPPQSAGTLSGSDSPSRPSTAASHELRDGGPPTALSHQASNVESLSKSSDNGSTASFVRRIEATQPELARWLAYAEDRPISPPARNPSRGGRHTNGARRRTSLPAQTTLSQPLSSVPAVSSKPIAKQPLKPILSEKRSKPLRAVSVPVTDNASSVQYPAVRPPAASGSFADTSITIPKRVRMKESALPPRKHRSADLSTVFSESGQSASSRQAGRSSARSSHPADSGPSGGSSLLVERPSSRVSDLSHSARATSNRRSSTIRIVSGDDQHDAQDRRWPTPRRSSRAYDPPYSERRRSTPAEPRERTVSRYSEAVTDIPAWTRYIHRASSAEPTPTPAREPRPKDTSDTDTRAFYAQGTPDPTIALVSPSSSASGGSRASTPAPSTSPTSDRFPPAIHRPRTRPRQSLVSGGYDGPSDAGDDALPYDEEDITIHGPPRTRLTRVWSPRLAHDKRASRMSFWEAPQLTEKPPPQSTFWEDDPSERDLLRSRALQVSLFCLGFLVPFAWMCASLLPLPTPPPPREMPTRRSKALEIDVEAHVVVSGENTRYENARWWRGLNRIMSVVGLCVVGAIIALVVVAVAAH